MDEKNAKIAKIRYSDYFIDIPVVFYAGQLPFPTENYPDRLLGQLQHFHSYLHARYAFRFQLKFTYLVDK